MRSPAPPPSRSQDSTFAKLLEPLASGLWIVFLLTSTVVGAVWAFGIGDAQLAAGVTNPSLLASLQWLLQHFDLLWFTLAAINSYLCLTRRSGLLTARRSSLAILLSVIALGWLSSRTGFPLGRIQFGQVLGAKLGAVPLGLPLFWFTVIIGAREGLLRLFPRWSHLQISLGTGLLGLLTDLSLEPLASKLRGFWFWRPATLGLPPVFEAPWSNCLVWGLFAGLLAYFLRERSVVAHARNQSWQPALTLGIFHLIFLAAHFGRWVRG